jgi:pimeloyl-ACP methyl ester carboxylesterase
VRERTILFGAGSGLVGTVALPAEASAISDIGFLLFNAGVIHRVGPHRINVRLARRLADRGIASIRFDLAGHGDSARPAGDHSFEDQAVIDIRSAMDALAGTANVRRFAIFGYCSGAYYGFAAAKADERVAAILMFDAYRYPTFKTAAVHYWNRLRQPRVTSGLVRALSSRLMEIGRRVLAPVRQGEAPAAPEIGRIDFIPPRREFAEGLKTLLDRGIQIHMVYSGEAKREYNYSGQFRDTVAPYGIGARIKADFLPDLNHAATGLADQSDLIARVVAWSGSLSPASPTSVALTS